MSLRSRAEELAARTPAERVRSIDFLRALSISLVVLGHWLVVAIVVRGDRVEGEHVLALLPWTHPLTWLFQVMPLFFLVGGFANARSWESERRERGGRWLSWALRRTERLLRPPTLFLGLGVATVVVARAAGADPILVENAGWLVNIALWFLAVYVPIAAGAPLMLALHERWGAWVLAALVGGVILVDVARIGFRVPFVGFANFALAWLALHHLGVLLHAGVLGRGRLLPAAMGAGGLLVVVGLTVAGPYPVSMVSVPGAELDNTAPPTVALVALGFTQAGVALALRPSLERWLRRPAAWLGVVTVNAVILTVYLWHMVPVVVVALAQREVGLLPQPEIGSGAWLALRVPWVAVLALVLAPLVALAGRFERGGRRFEAAADGRYGIASSILGGIGVLAASGALVLFTLGGLHGDGPLGLPVPAVTLYASALLLLWIAPRLPSPGRSG